MYKFLGSTDILMYDLLNGLGYVLAVIYNFSMIRQKKELLGNKSKFLINYCKKRGKCKLFSNTTFWTIIETFFITCVQFVPAAFFNSGFGKLVNTGLNYFGLIFFVPVLLYLFFRFLSVNPLKQLDLITPAFPLALICVKLACFCQGCCCGIECSWGLFNSTNDRYEVPVQLAEVGFALLIFIFFLFYKKKAKEGTLFPLYLIMYSATRFFSEFLRADANVFWILKTYHILCIIGVIYGLIALFIVNKYGERIVIKVSSDTKPYPWYEEKNIVHHKKRKNR